MAFEIPDSIKLAPKDMRAGFKAEILAIVDAAVETDTPTESNDFLMGTDLADLIDGLAGNDVITGLGGANQLFGGSGGDVILGGQQGRLYGDGNADFGQGDGRDFIFTENFHKFVLGGGGDDVIFGSSEDDFLRAGTGSDTVFGGGGNDNIESALDSPGGELDYLDGGNGDDSIGGAGTLIGGRGRDTIGGFAGSVDTLIGGRGSDTIVGLEGSDILFYAAPEDGRDRIYGFETGQDVFQFGAVDFGVLAGTVLVEGENFVAGDDPLAVSETPTVLFDTRVPGNYTAALLFDPDGAGTERALVIARFTDDSIPPSTPVAAGDILFV